MESGQIRKREPSGVVDIFVKAVPEEFRSGGSSFGVHFLGTAPGLDDADFLLLRSFPALAVGSVSLNACESNKFSLI